MAKAKKPRKQCRHKEIDILAVQITPNTFTGIAHLCKGCGAVRNSVVLGAKWRKGETKELCDNIIQEFGYRGYPHRFI